MVPINEASQVISDPQTAKTAQPVKDQPSSGPPKRIEIQPHLHGAWIYIHRQYQGSSSIVPQQLQLHWWHVRRVRHPDRPYSPTSPTQKTESSHWVQGGDKKRAGRDGMSRNHHQTDWAHTMGQLSYIPQEGKQQVEDMPWPTGWNKAIICENHKVRTLEDIAHVLTGATKFSKVDSNKAFFGMYLTEEASLLMTFITHLGRYRFLCVPFGLKMSQDIFQMRMDDIVAQCLGVLAIHNNVFIYGKDDKDHDANIIYLFNIAQ